VPTSDSAAMSAATGRVNRLENEFVIIGQSLNSVRLFYSIFH
jgi:hypothetical protein